MSLQVKQLNNAGPFARKAPADWSTSQRTALDRYIGAKGGPVIGCQFVGPTNIIIASDSL